MFFKTGSFFCDQAGLEQSSCLSFSSAVMTSLGHHACPCLEKLKASNFKITNSQADCFAKNVVAQEFFRSLFHNEFNPSPFPRRKAYLPPIHILL